MSDIYKLQYDGMTLAYPGWNGYVSYEAQSFKTLTLLNSEGGTLTANTLTGYPGDTINLSTAYNTYWRFSGYQLTGDGSLVGNDYTFGTEDATICACFKPNAFTATGGFEKGSNVKAGGYTGNKPAYNNVGAKYAIHVAHTGDIPTAWYSTSNRWNPTNASAYSINLKPKLSINFNWGYNYNGKQAWATACSYIGGTQTQSQSVNYNLNTHYSNTSVIFNYNKSFSTTTQSTYSISARFGISLHSKTSKPVSIATYEASKTTGGWTATGIAP